MPHGRHTETIILLGLLTALTPLSADMYLPALPALGSAFSTEPGHVQLSLATFFLGLAIGQAFYGPISDRFGRKAPLCTGLSLFVYVALLGCLYPNTTALAMEPYGEKAGSASALLGTLQFTLAATAATIVGATNNGTAMPMVAVLGASGILAFLLYRFLVRRRADVPVAAL